VPSNTPALRHRVEAGEYPPSITSTSSTTLASEECFPVEDNQRTLQDADSHIDLAADELPSVGGYPAEREEDVAPDYAPVTAAFDV
jgi:hypothetical protein